MYSAAFLAMTPNGIPLPVESKVNKFDLRMWILWVEASIMMLATWNIQLHNMYLVHGYLVTYHRRKKCPICARRKWLLLRAALTTTIRFRVRVIQTQRVPIMVSILPSIMEFQFIVECMNYLLLTPSGGFRYAFFFALNAFAGGLAML